MLGALQSPSTSDRLTCNEYPRYFFTNHSDDIRALFAHACDLVGVEYRQDGPRNVSVAKRESAAILDSFIGPKR